MSDWDSSGPDWPTFRSEAEADEYGYWHEDRPDEDEDEDACPVCGGEGTRDRPSLRILNMTCGNCGWHYTGKERVA